MNTILVLTDYSPASKKASLYAFDFARQMNVFKIVFYHAYQLPMVINDSSIMPAMPIEMMDVDVVKEASEQGMDDFKTFIKGTATDEFELDFICEPGDLSVNLLQVSADLNASVIFMGMMPHDKGDDLFAGSNVLSVIKEAAIPVVVIPENFTTYRLQNILLTCDFKKVAETIPTKTIESILNKTKAGLQVLNVYEDDKELTEKKVQMDLLHSLFKNYSPEFHFIKSENFIDAVNGFVDSHHIDLILAVPKKHGFFEGLFRERHAKKLALHSHVPLMYIHEKDKF